MKPCNPRSLGRLSMEILKVSRMKSLCPLCDYLDQRKFRKVSITMATVMLWLTICWWLYNVDNFMLSVTPSMIINIYLATGSKKQLNWTNKIFSEFLCKATEILENLHSFKLKLIFISVLKTQYLNYGRMKGLMKKLQWADGEWRIYS